MAEINREYKDRLFRFIFGREENRAWALSLYNAINDTEYTDESQIILTTVEDALYLGMKNDVSFLISDTLMLFEQQSSFNPNMPLRYLIYTGMIYSAYVTNTKFSLYSSSLQKIPAPRCVCFYNGEKETEDRQILKLSDAFINGNKGDIEVEALLININYGRNKELLKKCKPLGEYSWFINEIRKNTEKGMVIKDAVDAALDAMPDDFVIKPFLMKNKAEVEIMCITEYNEAETMELFKEEGRAEGREEGEAKGEIKGAIKQLVGFIKDGFISEKQAAERADMSLDEFRKYEALYCS